MEPTLEVPTRFGAEQMGHRIGTSKIGSAPSTGAGQKHDRTSGWRPSSGANQADRISGWPWTITTAGILQRTTHKQNQIRLAGAAGELAAARPMESSCIKLNGGC